MTAHDVPAQSDPQAPGSLARACRFAQPLIEAVHLETGEGALAHAQAVAPLLAQLGAGEDTQAAAYLVHVCAHLNKPQEVLCKPFGDSLAHLAVQAHQLLQVQRLSRPGQSGTGTGAGPQSTAALQTENVRKMLLAFSRDLRVVMLHLASRLQTLRFMAATKQAVPAALANESLQVFAPLANRLGVWPIKWELEDLAFRFLEPDTYKSVAGWLDEKRSEREQHMAALCVQLGQQLAQHGVSAHVTGRPKHIYSIVKKMRGKSLPFERVFDVRALRVVVPTVTQCYHVLSWVHEGFAPIEGEYDDYIARPKANGYQSLHTVVRDARGLPIEIQIRTQDMHAHAEHGVAAHWAYKEAGAKGYAGVSASSAYDTKIAVLRQLLAWERDLSGAQAQEGMLDDRIYVLTPEAAVIELPQGATALDFAYTVHTQLGHRCRGAKIDGQLLPLNTPLCNGQTVEIIAIKEGAPSRDWLNPDLGYLVSSRARHKVRSWFNAQITAEQAARGREAVEKLLQREGKTAIRLEDLASQLGFASAEALFEGVGKDAYSLRTIEAWLKPPEPAPSADDIVLLRQTRGARAPGPSGVLVVGVDSLLTQLARCCKPAPPDAIAGYVTRGKGVSIHRHDCSNVRALRTRSPERLIEVRWGLADQGAVAAVYPVDLSIQAADRPGLLRDISEVLSKEKINVAGVQTQTRKAVAFMTFTAQTADASVLPRVLQAIAQIKGVQHARRR